jgi:hypothetical protein
MYVLLRNLHNPLGFPAVPHEHVEAGGARPKIWNAVGEHGNDDD